MFKLDWNTLPQWARDYFKLQPITTNRQRVAVVILTLVVLGTTLLLAGMHTGRIGFTFVKGNSLASVFPDGSLIVILPLQFHEGDYVVAWTWGGMDGAGEAADKKPGFVVKRYVHGRLESTDSPERYSSSYHVTGVVVRWLPVRRLFWWMDQGVQTPIPIPQDPEALQHREFQKMWGNSRSKVRVSQQDLNLKWAEAHATRVQVAGGANSKFEFRATGNKRIVMVRSLQTDCPHGALVKADDKVVNYSITLEVDGASEAYFDKAGARVVEISASSGPIRCRGVLRAEVWLKKL